MKICLIYNFAQHYRTNIFTLMDQNMDVEFVFGDHYLNVKKMDYSLLRHKVTEVKNLFIGPIGWQTGVVKLAFMKYDCYIILSNPMIISSWLLLILCRLRGKRIFLWTHGWYGKENYVERTIKKIFFKIPNGLILYGNHAKDLMIKEGFESGKLHVVHNSLMYDQQIEIRKSLKSSSMLADHFENRSPNVVFVGRLTPVKKLNLLLEALFINKQRGFDFNVTFIGDGSELGNLKLFVENKALESNVWFYGPTYDEKELSMLLYSADLCVAPGNIGLTAMHAMAYGCPCISHNDFKWQMPEFEAIKEGITGEFFERDNAESLANSITNWLSTHENKREEVRNACFKEIDEHWNPHKQLEIIKNVIGD